MLSQLSYASFRSFPRFHAGETQSLFRAFPADG